MDVLSHFFIPYVAALFVLGLHKAPRSGVVDVARRETYVAYAVIFGLAGFAPDLDSLFSWAKHYDGLYALQHRGASHTLLFAPLLGLVPMILLHLMALWRPARFGRFRFRPGFVPVAIVGSWTHLLLDAFTYSGIPLWWPFSFDRVGHAFFHWIVPALFPIVLLILGIHLWGRLRTRHVAWLGLVLILSLTAYGGVRDHYRPDVDDALMFPRSGVGHWTVVYPMDEGYEVVLFDRGTPVEETRTWYPHQVTNGTAWAVDRARETDAYRGFLLGRVGPLATETRLLEDGSVLVDITDVAARFEAQHDPRWTPTRPHDAWGYVSFHVTPERVEPRHLGW